MLICAAADIHYPREGYEWSAALAHTMCASGADVIVLAGDIATGAHRGYGKMLGLFGEFEGPKLFVPGNHDLWSNVQHPDTRRRYRAALRRIVEDNGFHYLPGAPRVVGDTGFVGVAGWYDYRFRQTEPPQPGVRVTPLRAARGEMATALYPIGGRARLPWSALTDEDYAGKALVWEDGEGPRSLVWNDGIYTDWHASDRAVTRQQAQEIMRDAAAVPLHVPRLVGVCHFVPFADLLGPPSNDVGLAYCRAYMGSPLLGKAFSADPRFRLVLCGHAHEQRVLHKDDMVVANCSVGDRNAGPLLLTLPDGDDP